MNFRAIALACTLAFGTGCTSAPSTSNPTTALAAPAGPEIYVTYADNNPLSGVKAPPKPGKEGYNEVLFSRALKSNSRGDRFPDYDSDAAILKVPETGEGLLVLVSSRIPKSDIFPEFCEVSSADQPPRFAGRVWIARDFLFPVPAGRAGSAVSQSD